MPNLDERRRIEELIVRYELEPTIRDIYVEGLSDKVLIEWFLHEVTLEDVAVYEISTVTVPFEKVTSLGLEDNNRGRVITLAFALNGGTGMNLAPVVACIADTDFDHILDRKYDCPILIFTGYTSIEAYLYKDDVLGKFLNLVITTFPYESSTVLSELGTVLQELFLIRLANQELGLGIEYMSFERSCTVTGSRLHFDKDNHIYRYLNKGAQLLKRELFEQTIAKYREKISGDPRMYIHGHDFVNLLLFYITKIKRPRTAYDTGLFAKSLRGVLELKHLIDEPLFAELIRRFK